MSLRQREEYEADGHTEFYYWEPQPKKRRLRGKRGGLENLPQMPLDIIIEILGYLKPQDLLSLARTSINFRKYLMARSAAPLWKAARKNVKGLPDCPGHLSEPQYANLVFDTHCHACSRPGVKMILWQFSARYCADCRKTYITRCGTPSSECVLTDSCLDLWLCYIIKEDKSGEFIWHHEPEVSALVDKYEAGLLNLQVADALIAKNTAIMEHARLCEEWQQSVQDDRQLEIEKIREHRFLAVYERLSECGYGEELDLMCADGRIDNFLDLPFLKQPKALTDRMWSNAQEEIFDYMDDSIERRLYREREHTLMMRVKGFRHAYQTWWSKQPNKNVLPRVIDIISHSRYVNDFVRLNDASEDYDDASTFFPSDVEEWRTDCEAVLRSLVMESSSFQGRIPDGVDPLTLAAVAFSCTACDQKYKLPPLYPSVLTHQCCYNYPHASSQLLAVPGIDSQLGRIISLFTSSAAPWSARTLRLTLWHKRATEIIKACGQDPTTVTREEMDALPARLWCTWCSEHYSAGDIRQVMTWRDAFNHYNFHDKRNGEMGIDYATDDTVDSPLKWACMSGDEITDVIKMEKEHSRTYYSDFLNRGCEEICYVCMHCDYSFNSEGFKAVIRHLRIMHSIHNPTQDDFYQPADAEPFLTRPVIIRRRTLRRMTPDDADSQIEIIQFRTGCAAPAYIHDF